MLQALAILKAVFQLTPLIIEGVQALESAMPQNGQGAVKLDLLKGWLQTAVSAEQTLEVPFNMIWPMVTPLIAAVVAASKKPA
jgi:hypothetical protein